MSIAARQPAVTFAIIVLALGGLVFLAGLGRETTPFALVLVIPVAAIVSAWLAGGPTAVRGLFVRIARWRVPVRWYLLAIGIPLAGTLAIDLVAILTGQAGLDAVVAGVTASAIVIPLVVLLPALLEEFAWRGYGVHTVLQRGHGFAAAALGPGVVFAAIHVPLYLPGQLYDNLPIWPSALTLLGYSVLLAWIFVGSGGSSLVAGICHAALNGFVPLTWGIDSVWVWETRGIVFALLGLAILAWTIRRPIAERPEVEPAPSTAS
jgi:membrane protease YdiL (CAAX protease family)